MKILRMHWKGMAIPVVDIAVGQEIGDDDLN